MNPRFLISMVALVVLVPATPARADVKLPAVFSDSMVLQGNLAVPVFGLAEPGEEVSVEFRGRQKKAIAGKDGKWLVRLAPLQPGGPFEMTIAGKNTLRLKDVLNWVLEPSGVRYGSRV